MGEIGPGLVADANVLIDYTSVDVSILGLISSIYLRRDAVLPRSIRSNTGFPHRGSRPIAGLRKPEPS